MREFLVRFDVGDEHRLQCANGLRAHASAIEGQAAKRLQESVGKAALLDDHQVLLGIHQLEIPALRPMQRDNVIERRMQLLAQAAGTAQPVEHGLEQHAPDCPGGRCSLQWGQPGCACARRRHGRAAG
nr:hypothetical protein [Ramlibacter monticola]